MARKPEYPGCFDVYLTNQPVLTYFVFCTRQFAIFVHPGLYHPSLAIADERARRRAEGESCNEKWGRQGHRGSTRKRQWAAFPSAKKMYTNGSSYTPEGDRSQTRENVQCFLKTEKSES